MHPDNQTPINHIKPPKPKPPNPSTAHYPTQSPLKKTITIYAPERVTGSSLTLVLLGPNTQPYTDNYGLNRYHPTPTTILSTSPAHPPTFVLRKAT